MTTQPGVGTRNNLHYCNYYSAADLNNSQMHGGGGGGHINHYEDNILLQFATEHNRQPASSGTENHHHQKQRTSTTSAATSQLASTGPIDCNQTPASGQRESSHLRHQPASGSNAELMRHSHTMQSMDNSLNHHHQQQQQQPARASRTRQRLGKFVSYYPAERQPKSRPSSRHTSPYAFHVPPNRSPSPGYRLLASSTNTSGIGQSQYGYAMATSQHMDVESYHLNAQHHHQATLPPNVPSARRLNRSFKSRTIAHIPSEVQGVSSAMDTTGQQHQQQQQDYGTRSSQHCLDHRQQPAELLVETTTATSAADLLKAHRIQSSRPIDQENPFKPGTDLSLEADIMVKLIVRGYPLHELPNLVEATKGVARETTAATTTTTTNSKKQHQGDKLDVVVGPRKINAKQSNWPSSGQLDNNNKSFPAQTNGRSALDRQANCLAACKQAWGNSLARAKSLPRVYSSSPIDRDADSLDKLISNIEQEISELISTRQSAQNNLANEKGLPETMKKVTSDGNNCGTINVLVASEKLGETRRQTSTQNLGESPKKRQHKELNKGDQSRVVIVGGEPALFKRLGNNRKRNNSRKEQEKDLRELEDEVTMGTDKTNDSSVERKKKAGFKCCTIH